MFSSNVDSRLHELDDWQGSFLLLCDLDLDVDHDMVVKMWFFTILLLYYAVVDFSMNLMQVQGFETPHRVQDIYEEGQKIRCKPF